MKRKQIISLIIVFILACAYTCSFVSVSASNKNITVSMKNNSGIEKIAKRLSAYCIGYSMSKKTNNLTIKNTNKKRLSIAAYVRYNFNGDADYTQGELKNTVKNLFGKNVKKFQCSEFLMENPYDFYNGEFAYAGGDWGNMHPRYKIDKVTKNGKKYKVEVTGKIYHEFNRRTSKQCKITLKLKRFNKSIYGFVATGIKYKKYKGGM